MMEKYYRFNVAPMLDWTDSHCRYFYRVMSQYALLYSEMVTTGAIIHGDRDRHLAFSEKGPTALQLGGSSIDDLTASAKIGEDYGYDEINLNCGCPSDRVQKGRFGACLMAEPRLVADAVDAMINAISIPVTIKARIGIDDQDDYEFLTAFIDQVSSAGCDIFILHARKAWLSGLSPKENRDIPPLNYERVYQIKRNYPDLTIIINGGIKTYSDINTHLKSVDGVMLGREVYSNPYLLASVDREIYGDCQAMLSRWEIIKKMESYINAHLEQGGRLNHIVRHMLGLFHGMPKSRLWRRYLSEEMHKNDANFQTVVKAYQQMMDAQ